MGSWLARERFCIDSRGQGQWGEDPAVPTPAPSILLLLSLLFFFSFFPCTFILFEKSLSLLCYLSIKTSDAVASIGPDGVGDMDYLCPASLMTANIEFIRSQASKTHAGQSRNCN